MYRTFHSKVGWWYWLLMGVTAFLLLDFFWFHHTVLMILTAVAMVFEIEMLIHTCYILTEDGRLRIESGRFVPDTEIEIRSITGMRRAVQVSPRHAGDFMAWVQKKMNADNKPNTE